MLAGTTSRMISVNHQPSVQGGKDPGHPQLLDQLNNTGDRFPQQFLLAGRKQLDSVPDNGIGAMELQAADENHRELTTHIDRSFQSRVAFM